MEGVKEAPVTNAAGVGDAFAGPRLRTVVQKHNLGAIDDVCLNPGNVQILLNLANPYHIMVRRPPYLRKSQHIQHSDDCSFLQNFPQKRGNWGFGFTWIARWSLWKLRQSEQRGPLKQSKQNMLHSLLCAAAWSLHWPKKLVWSRGPSHGGHLLSSSSPPSPPPWNHDDQIINFGNRRSDYSEKKKKPIKMHEWTMELQLFHLKFNLINADWNVWIGR